MSQRLTTLRSWAALLEAGQNDPFLRLEIPQTFDGPGYALGGAGSAGAVVIQRVSAMRGPGVLLTGAPEAAAELLHEVVATGLWAEFPHRAITADADVLPNIEAVLDLGTGGDWDWMWTESEPPEVAGEDRVEALTEDDHGALAELINTHNPGSDGRPGEVEGQRWLGIRDADGRLVACGVDEPNLAGFPVLAGITVNAAERGRGLGKAITAALTRGSVARDGLCTLGMYATNTVARGLYHSLGYTTVHQWRSRAVVGVRESASLRS